jgi:hypothetical protein
MKFNGNGTIEGLSLGGLGDSGAVDSGSIADPLEVHLKSGRKNLIINGDMRIHQRGVSQENINGYGSIDRWYMGGANNVNPYPALPITSQHVFDQVERPGGFRSYLKKTFGDISTYAESNGPYYWTSTLTSIESQDLDALGYGTPNAKSLTLSFWVRSSVAGNHSFTLQNYADGEGLNRRSYCTQYTINAANTFEYKTITIPGDTVSGFDDALTEIGLQLRFSHGTTLVDDYVTPDTGQWLQSDKFFVTDSVNLVEINNSTWEITGVQLELGSVATDFEYRSYGEELALCQRYYEVIYCSQEIVACVMGDATGTTWQGSCRFDWKVEKRGIPTVNLPDAGQAPGEVSFLNFLAYPTTTGSHTLSDITVSGLRILASEYEGLGPNIPGFFYSGGDSTITIDAEL